MRLPALFNHKEFYKKLFSIAIPIMLQNLIGSFVNMVDTVMIGRLGTVEIAAVGLGNNVFFLYMILLFGICSGGSVFTAQFWGRHDIRGIRKNMGLCLFLNLSAALVFTLAVIFAPARIMGIYSRDPAVIKAGVSYLSCLAPSFIPFAVSQAFVLSLRSTEKVGIPMVTSAISLSLNVILNWLLIFGMGPFPRMEVAGAALATTISRFAEALLLIFICYRGRLAVAGSLREFTAFNGLFTGRFIRIALPVIVNEFLWSLGVTAQNIIFARTHTDAIAAFNITGTVSQLTWVLFIGLGNGVGVLIGKKIGEGDHAAARDYASRILRFAPLLAAGAACLLIPISQIIPLIFRVNREVIAGARLMLLVQAFSYPVRAFNMSMIVGVGRAGGDTVFCGVYDVLYMWVISLPLAAAASYFFQAPAWIVYLCVISEEPMKFFTGLWRYRSGKWLHDVTEGL